MNYQTKGAIITPPTSIGKNFIGLVYYHIEIYFMIYFLYFDICDISTNFVYKYQINGKVTGFPTTVPINAA